MSIRPLKILAGLHKLQIKCGGNVIRDKNALPSNSGIEIESTDHAVQNLAPPNNLQRFEGIVFSFTANNFTWEHSARRLVETLEELHERHGKKF